MNMYQAILLGNAMTTPANNIKMLADKYAAVDGYLHCAELHTAIDTLQDERDALSKGWEQERNVADAQAAEIARLRDPSVIAKLIEAAHLYKHSSEPSAIEMLESAIQKALEQTK